MSYTIMIHPFLVSELCPLFFQALFYSHSSKIVRDIFMHLDSNVQHVQYNVITFGLGYFVT